MNTYENLRTKTWWSYLEEDLRELLTESFILSIEAESWEYKFHDYSFVVFPAAKAYEGFLKKMFFDLEFIVSEDYYGSRFRIGRALNPSVERKHGEENIYDKITKHCIGGRELADKLWITWKDARNTIFHWFPDEKRAITLVEAKVKLDEIIDAIDDAYKECKIN